MLAQGRSSPLILKPATLTRAQPATPRYKRVLDVGLIVLALPVLVPVMLILMLLVRLTSRGPALFVQTRIGRGGRPFRMIKLRSMYRDAEARRAAVLALSDRPGACFKAKSDPRITPLGRFLRRASLDELPQLWNVLVGDMSLVGPRPALPEEVAIYPADALRRLDGLPGLTGLWQISGRADLSFDEMVALDLEYLSSASLGTDLRILCRTFGAVASARGAY